MQGAQKPISGRIVIQKNDVSGLLTSDIVSVFPHVLQNIPVSDFCFLYVDSLFFSHQSKSQVAHDRHNNRILLQSALLLHVVAADCHHLIAVYQIALFIDRKHTIRISVKRDTGIRLLVHNACLQLIHVGRSAVRIDVGSVRVGVNRHQFRAKIAERLDGRVIRRTLRAVHHDLFAVQIDRNTFFHKFHIFILQIKTVFDLSHAGSDRKYHVFHVVADQRFNLILQCIGKLVALPVEKFDAVKFHRIV